MDWRGKLKVECWRNVTVCSDRFKVLHQSLSFLFAVIRAKVVGKKLLRDGPFGTMRYTVKQMKVSASIVCLRAAEQYTESLFG